MLNRRVQILFDKDAWNKLVKHAKAQNVSAGEYIRRAVRKYVEVYEEEIKESKKSPFKKLFRPGHK